jgi:lysophospholipase L1-like esterase
MILKNILISSLFLLCHSPGKDSIPVLNNANTAIITPAEMGCNELSNVSGLRAISDKIAGADTSAVLLKVMHIGDSHIKAGFFSQQLMEKLNAYYASKYRRNIFFDFQCFSKVGTKYSDYIRLAELDQQLIDEQPDLVIISLGTNDAFSGSSRKNFYQKVDHLITKINQLSPQSSIIITTPSDALKYDKIEKTYSVFPEVKNVANTLSIYANDHNIACWDLYTIMGGENSMGSWVQSKLAGPDRIHFTAKGYDLLAEWFFTAFVNAIQDNLAMRQPVFSKN